MSDDDLKKQYREFLKRLEESTRQYSIEQLREIDPKDILKLFLEPGVISLLILKWLCKLLVCAVSKYLASLYWNLLCWFSRTILIPRKNMKKESTTEEFMIAVNGPSLGHADAVIREAMNSYWKSKAQKRGGSTLVLRGIFLQQQLWSS